MKTRTLPLAVVLSMVLIHTMGAVPKPGPGRASATRAQGNQSSRIESVIPREGLQFYLKISSAGLAEIMRGGNAATVSRMLATGPLKMTTGELAAFVTGNAGALSTATLAVVSYGSKSPIVVVEAASASAAEQLGAAATRLVGNRASQKSSPSDVEVVVRGQMLFAGERAAIARMSAGGRTLANDQEFSKARARFSEDQVFAFIELNTANLWSPAAAGAGIDAAQTAGMLAAMGGLPYAIAAGGSLKGDTATVRAVMLNASKPGTGGVVSGLLGSLFSASKTSARLGEPVAANFAGQNADVFVDLMIDWDQLLDAIQSMFGMFAGAVASGASDQPASAAHNADFLAMAEASLGFSFKHDLIPTLGNELAITLTGFSPAQITGPGASAAGKKSSPQFLLMVAVRDEVKFEKLLGKLFKGPLGSGAGQVARSLYRGATINSSGGFAYAITGGFLLAGGNVAEIRRAIDAHALGNSLATTAEFRQAMGSSRPAGLRAFISSRLSKELLDSLSKGTTKVGGGSDLAATMPQTASAIGLSVIPDDDGLMIEARVPTNLALLALGAMLNAAPPPYGITSPAGPDSQPSRAGGRSTPKLTDEDLRSRRP